MFSAGDGSATLDRIAQEAGVGIATLYRHFPSREALATAVYDDVLSREIQPIIDEFDHTHASRDLLLRLGERLLAVLDRERGLTASIATIAHATRAFLERNRTSIGRAVRRAQEVGELRRDISAMDIQNLITMIVAAFGTSPTDPLGRRSLILLLDALDPARAH